MNVLSKGAFGTVFLVKKITTENVYAMKVMEKKEIKAQRMSERILNERRIMSLLRQQNNFVTQLLFVINLGKINDFGALESLPNMC